MKTLKKYKVVSGALQFTIFIGVIIALLLAGLVMLQNTHNFFIQQSKATIENIQLANSGIQFLLQNEKPISDTITIDQLSDENQKVEVNLSKWGIFEKAIVKTTHREKIFYKSALVGTQIQEKDRPVLYLQDNNKPLVLVANAIIKGTVFAPSQGVRPGYIAGESFYGQQLVQGSIKTSQTQLPKLKRRYREELEFLINQFNYNSSEYTNATNGLLKTTNSFLKPIKIIYNEGWIQLSNTELTGNIIIKSDIGIKIDKSAILKDILIIAPTIEITDEVIGNFQCIANKKISVGKNCKLYYPSSLVVIQEDEKKMMSYSQPQEYQISIDKNSEVRGSVVFFKSIKENDFKTEIKLEEEATIKGEVYCQGNFELKGKVVGSIFTEQFIVNRAGSTFINHIYNGQIVNDNFPESFSGILFENYPKGIAKWMY